MALPASASRASAHSSVGSELWYEFLNGDESAMPVQWTELEERLHPDEILVCRPGYEGWTALKDLLRVHSPVSVAGGVEAGERDGPPARGAGEGGASKPRGASEGGMPRDVQRGISVRYDPVTGGLSGLPEGWAGLLPAGCTRDTVHPSALPPTLCPTATPTPGMRLFDGPIVGMPFNVHKWQPACGASLIYKDNARIRILARVRGTESQTYSSYEHCASTGTGCRSSSWRGRPSTGSRSRACFSPAAR